MGSDETTTKYELPELISIHAPAWGATSHWRLLGTGFMISIHAPAWGATYGCRPTSVFLQISIHAPAWGATVPNGRIYFVETISIHAPAWGATDCDYDNIKTELAFQSTLPRGERRPTPSRRCRQRRRFQSTLPRGERLPADPTGAVITHFNPRSRVGSDGPYKRMQCRRYISIHAPAWGATRYVPRGHCKR